MGHLTGKPMRPDWTSAWAAVRERMRRELGDPVFEAWIGPLNLESFDKDELKIGAAKPFVRNWVANHYVARIERAFRAEGAEPNSISIVLSSAPAPVVAGGVSRETPAPSASIAYLPPPASSREEDGARGLWNRMLHPQQTFDSFIPGPANEFGHGAARAFAEGQQSDIPLLYIHGGFGFGKTHLLNAAALEFRKRGKRTLFLRAEDFMRHFLGALYRKDTLAFKEELRTAEVLIIDDLQHICRSTATASEFLYTVNAFADLRRRVVIAADRAPAGAGRAWAPTSNRAWPAGWCIALDKPDRDTRLAILKARAAEFARHKPDVVLPESGAGTHRRPGGRQPARADRRLHQARDLCRSHQEAGDPGDGRGSGGPAHQSRAPRPRSRTSSARPPSSTSSTSRTSIRPSAPAAWPGRGRWRCICRASSPPARCPRSGGASAAATTPRCCMPAAASRP